MLHATKNCELYSDDQMKPFNSNAWQIIGSSQKNHGIVVYLNTAEDEKKIKIKATNSFYKTNSILENIYSIESFLSDHCYVHQKRILEHYELLVMISAIAEIDIDASKANKSKNWLRSNWWAQYQAIENYVKELNGENLNLYIIQQLQNKFPNCKEILLTDDAYGMKFSKSDEMHALKEALHDYDFKIFIQNNSKYW